MTPATNAMLINGMARPSVETRFWSKVKKSDGCWVWTRPPTTAGYGQIWVEGHFVLAHRFSYELHNGPAGNLCVLHECDNRLCIRPDHLFLGTYEDNMKDAAEKKRLARGDAHWSRRRPEKVARGDRHGSRTKPESRAVGLRNGAYTHPEKRVHVRGEANGQAKLTAADVDAIVNEYATSKTSHRKLAAKYGVTHQLIGLIIRKLRWNYRH